MTNPSGTWLRKVEQVERECERLKEELGRSDKARGELAAAYRERGEQLTKANEELVLQRSATAKLTQELERQKALVKEGHRQYDAAIKDRNAIANLRDEYRTTIHVLSALLAAKPRVQHTTVAINWPDLAEQAYGPVGEEKAGEVEPSAWKSWVLKAESRYPKAESTPKEDAAKIGGA